MHLTIDRRPDGVTLATLTGRMDIEGAATVDLQFSLLGGTEPLLVVDMSGVDFIASMGLRTLTTCMRAMGTKHHRMALAALQPDVMQVVLISGIDEVIPVYPDVASAVAALLA